MNLCSNHFFQDFGKERRFEIGRKLLRSLGYRPGFLSIGVIIADLRGGGTVKKSIHLLQRELEYM